MIQSKSQLSKVELDVLFSKHNLTEVQAMCYTGIQTSRGCYSRVDSGPRVTLGFRPTRVLNKSALCYTEIQTSVTAQCTRVLALHLDSDHQGGYCGVDSGPCVTPRFKPAERLQQTGLGSLCYTGCPTTREVTAEWTRVFVLHRESDHQGGYSRMDSGLRATPGVRPAERLQQSGLGSSCYTGSPTSSHFCIQFKIKP
jgi:hypothetical protein